MPTYSYKCQNCEHELEVVRSMKDEPLIHCDECDKDELNLAIQACIEIGDFSGMQLR